MVVKTTFFCKKYNSRFLMNFEWVVAWRAYYSLQNIMTDEILKKETNTELIASTNDSSGIFRPCTHYQDEEVLSNTEVEDSSDMQIDSLIVMVKLIVTNEDQQEDKVTVVTTGDVFTFFKKNKNLDSETVLKTL